MRGSRSLRHLAGAGVAMLSVALAVAPTGGAATHRSPAAGLGLAAAPFNGSTQRASVGNDSPPTADGTQAPGGGYDQAMSGDGRYVAFTARDSLWTDSSGNAVVEDDGIENVFVRDVVHDVTMQVSVAKFSEGPTLGTPDNDSSFPSISDNGRYVSFVTASTNAADNDIDSEDYQVVVCDRGAPSDTGDFAEPPVDPSPGSDPYPALQCKYVADLAANLFADGWPRLSGDGSRLVFAAGNGEGRNVVYALTVLDSAGNVIGYPPLTVVAGAGVPASLSGITVDNAVQPAVSRDGQWVAFAGSQVTTPGTRAIIRAHLPDLADSDTWTFDRVDIGDTGGFVGSSDIHVGDPSIADGGAVVAFDADDGGQGEFFVPQVYAWTSGAPASVLVSRTAGTAADPQGTDGDGFQPVLSADGRYIAFVTDNPAMTAGLDLPGVPIANCMIGGLTSFAGSRLAGALALAPQPAARTPCQVVQRDLVVDAAHVAAHQQRLPAQLASAGGLAAGCNQPPDFPLCLADADSFGPLAISNDGLHVSFESMASDLVPNDTNGVDRFDAFVHSWQPGLDDVIGIFGDTQLGTSVSTGDSFTGTGFGPYQIDSVVIDPASANPGDFTVGDTCNHTAVHEEQTCLFSITFTPGGLGPRSATIQVFQPDPQDPSRPAKEPALTFTVTGNGTPLPPTAAEFSATPDPLSFGAHRPLDRPVQRVLTIANPGGGPLQITGADVLDGAQRGTHRDYTVDLSGCPVVPAGGSCDVPIGFVGHAAGPRDALLVVHDNGPTGLNVVSLDASVPRPTVTVNPGVSPPGRVVIVSGTGFAPHRLVDVTLDGFPERASAVTDARGAFDVGLVLFRSTVQGPQTVSAHTHAASGSIAGHGPLLITLGSVDLPDLMNRH